MKKMMKVVTHPYVIMILFCALIISGEQMGGFYLFYLVLGLPHFVLHAVLGVLGIAVLFISAVTPKGLLASILNIAGATCMVASLLRFFSQPGASYNYQTFHLFVPVALMAIFAIEVLVFVVWNVKNLETSKL